MSKQESPAQAYEEYLGPTIADPFTRVLLEQITPRDGQRVLDVASGTGSVARQVAPLVGANGRVVALDVNPEMLAVGRILPATGAAIEWLEGDATELKLPDAAFDLVLSQQGLQFFPDRAAALQEMWRVLVAGGDVAVNVWRSLDLHPLHQALFEAVARRLDVPLDTLDIAFSLSNAEELRTLLHDAGFRNVRIIERSLEIRLPAPERFVHLTVLGAATSIPAFSQMDSTTRTELVEAVTRETEPIIRGHRDGDTLVFPMTTHIGTGYKPSESNGSGVEKSTVPLAQRVMDFS